MYIYVYIYIFFFKKIFTYAIHCIVNSCNSCISAPSAGQVIEAQNWLKMYLWEVYYVTITYLFNKTKMGKNVVLDIFLETRAEAKCYSALTGCDWWDECWLYLQQQLRHGTSFPLSAPLMLCSTILSIKTSSW